MADAIGQILVPALGVTLSPFPIVAVILMLTSVSDRARSVAFALGWMLGLATLVGVLLLIAHWIGVEPGADGPSTTASVIQLALGAGLLVLAFRKWSSRPKRGQTPSVPGWTESITPANPLKALVIGIGLSGLNPKNLMLNISAGTAIASATASVTAEVVAWGLYIILASLSVLGPVAWALVSPDTAAARLDDARQWLIKNSTAMMAVTLLVIGVSQVGSGITGLG